MARLRQLYVPTGRHGPAAAPKAPLHPPVMGRSGLRRGRAGGPRGEGPASFCVHVGYSAAVQRTLRVPRTASCSRERVGDALWMRGGGPGRSTRARAAVDRIDAQSPHPSQQRCAGACAHERSCRQCAPPPTARPPLVSRLAPMCALSRRRAAERVDCGRGSAVADSASRNEMRGDCERARRVSSRPSRGVASSPDCSAGDCID